MQYEVGNRSLLDRIGLVVMEIGLVSNNSGVDARVIAVILLVTKNAQTEKACKSGENQKNPTFSLNRILGDEVEAYHSASNAQ